MKIAHYQQTSLIDLPGHISCVIFCQGCNMNCEYCQNPDLIDQSITGKIPWKVMMEFLVKRRRQLEAVIFSGGEPTIQPDLVNRIWDVKRLGYAVGLHTNGSGQEFGSVAGLCDYILLSHQNPVKLKLAKQAKVVELSTVVWNTDINDYENDIAPYKKREK